MATPAINGSVSSGRRTANNTTALTFSHTTLSSSDVLLVIVGTSDIVTNTVTFNGSALTKIYTHANAGHQIGWYFLRSPSVGSLTVSVTPGSNATICAVAYNISNWAQWRMAEQAAAIFGSAAPTVDINSGSGELVIDFVASSAFNQTFTAGAGQTSLVAQDSNADGSVKCGSSSEPGASTNTMSWTLGVNATNIVGALAIRGLGAAPSGAPGGFGPVSAAQTIGPNDTLTILHEVRSQDAYLVVIAGASNSDTTISGITFNGSALTQHTQANQSAVFYLASPASGIYELTVTSTSAARGIGMLALSMNIGGIRAVGTENSFDSSTDVTTTVGDYVADYWRQSAVADVTGTPGGSQTILYQQPVKNTLQQMTGGPSSYATASGTTTTMTMTQSPSGFASRALVSMIPPVAVTRAWVFVGDASAGAGVFAG